MDVNRAMLSEVMTPEQREAYLPAYRKVLARKHVLARAQKRMTADVAENTRQATSLSLLSGGLPMERHVSGQEVRRLINTELAVNWSHPQEYKTEYYGKMFQAHFEREMPFSVEDMDKYADNTVDLFEYTEYSDNMTFWLWAYYKGDYKKMIACEANAAGFTKREKN